MMTYEDRVKAFKSQHGIGRARVKPPPMRRGYAAGQVTRLTADWTPATSTADAEIRYDIATLKDRSRDGERSNEWIDRALEVYEDNVLNDEDGFALKVKSTRPPDFTVLDKDANRKIEAAWKEFCLAENCTEEGEDGMADVLALCLRSGARDGNLLIKKIFDPNVNRFGFTLKLLEIDYLDLNYTAALSEGQYVIMGVQKNRKGQRVGYHFLERHAGDTIFGSSYGGRRAQMVPASQIIHYFHKQRTTQTIGVPWFAPAMVRLHHLRQYEIAELTAAREASEKGGYWQNERGTPYAGDGEFGTGPEGQERTGTYSDSEPGQKDEMPPGWKFVPYDPTHPTDAFGDFVTASLLGAAAGMGVSYMTLTGDLSKANYSSLRSGSLAEQRGFKKLQKHMIRQLMLPIFSAWLEAALLNGALNLPFSKFKIFNKPVFSGRRWEWVDPMKDAQASLLEIDGGLNTRARVIAERDGRDIEDVFAELKAEQDLAKQYDLTFASQAKAAPPPPDEPDDDDDDDDLEEVEPARNGHSKNLLTP